jgi:hypothetical protein
VPTYVDQMVYLAIYISFQSNLGDDTCQKLIGLKIMEIKIYLIIYIIKWKHEKRSSHAKVKVFPKDCIFHMAISISLYYIFHIF